MAGLLIFCENLFFIFTYGSINNKIGIIKKKKNLTVRNLWLATIPNLTATNMFHRLPEQKHVFEQQTSMAINSHVFLLTPELQKLFRNILKKKMLLYKNTFKYSLYTSILYGMGFFNTMLVTFSFKDFFLASNGRLSCVQQQS